MKPRVAFVIPYLRSRGGWQTAALGAIRALARHVEPVLVVSRADLPSARELLAGFETHVVPEVQPLSAGPWHVARATAAAALGVRRLPPLKVDLVHALEAFPAGWVARAIAQRERVPFGLTAHGTYAVIWGRWPFTARLYAGVLREAAFVCPISHGTLTRMQRGFGAAMRGATCEVVLEGTDITQRVTRAELQARRCRRPTRSSRWATSAAQQIPPSACRLLRLRRCHRRVTASSAEALAADIISSLRRSSRARPSGV
jgi:hypothetical protein